MVLCPGYSSSAARGVRERAAALDRIGGIDGNVSHLSIVSLPASLDPSDGVPASIVTGSPPTTGKCVPGRPKPPPAAPSAAATAPARCPARSSPSMARCSWSRTAISAPGTGCGASGSRGPPPACSSPPSTTSARPRAGDSYAASTWSTALSQHCLCGVRVTKTLRDREHRCTACGLAGRRDLVSAALAMFVRFHDVDDPKTSYLDTTMSRHAQITFAQGLEEALRESTAPSRTTARGADHAAVPRQRRGTSAPRTAGQRSRATPDEPRLQRDHVGKPGHRPGRNPQLTLW